MNNEERLAALDSAISEGRLIRHKWEDPSRNLVCLLTALSPEAGEQQSATACPASVMPQWLAHLTLWIDDAGSITKWPDVIRRYAAVAHTWGAWPPETWDRKYCQVLVAFVREAMRHTDDAKVLEVCERVAAFYEKRGRGEPMTEEEFAAVAAWAAGAGAEAVAAWAEAAAWAAAAAGAGAGAWPAAWAAADRMIETVLIILEQAPNAV